LTCDGQGSSHALENITDVLVHPFNRLLVVGFSFIDSGDDVGGISSRKRNVLEILFQRILDVARLEIVVVDLNFAREDIGLGVDEP